MIAGRDAEEENFLAGGEDAIGEEGGEKFWEPRATGEDEICGGDVFGSGDGCEFAEFAAKRCGRGLRGLGGGDLVGDADFLGLVDYTLDGTAGH